MTDINGSDIDFENIPDNTSDPFKCPVCGSELNLFLKGSTVGVICPCCDYSVVTTRTEPIYEDETIYTILLEAGNTCDRPRLKLISKLAGVNYLRAKEMIASAPVVLVEGELAYIILEMKKELDACGIKYSISPEFCYE